MLQQEVVKRKMVLEYGTQQILVMKNLLKGFGELFGRGAPLGYPQLKRIYASGIGAPDKYGRTFDFSSELAGNIWF